MLPWTEMMSKTSWSDDMLDGGTELVSDAVAARKGVGDWKR